MKRSLQLLLLDKRGSVHHCWKMQQDYEFFLFWRIPYQTIPVPYIVENEIWPVIYLRNIHDLIFLLDSAPLHLFLMYVPGLMSIFSTLFGLSWSSWWPTWRPNLMIYFYGAGLKKRLITQTTNSESAGSLLWYMLIKISPNFLSIAIIFRSLQKLLDNDNRILILNTCAI